MSEPTQNGTHPTSRTPLLLVFMLLTLAVFAAHSWVYVNAALDDSFITYRYARHLADGDGPVWNRGEAPVEGYTSFLWVVVNAAALRIHIHPLIASKIIGETAAAILIVVIFTPLNCIAKQTTSRVAAAALLVLNPAIAFYAQSGMENLVFTMLVTVAALALTNSETNSSRNWRLAAGALFGVASLCRPEGPPLFFVALISLLLSVWLQQRRVAFAKAAQFSFAMLAVWLPYFLWRFHYYGYPFPNTYYAKHTGGGLNQWIDGSIYLAAGIAAYLGVPAAFVIGSQSAVFGKGGNSTHRATPNLAQIYGFGAAAFACAYVLKVGGDDISAFPALRLFMPVLPIVYLVAAGYFDAWQESKWKVIFAGLLVAACTLTALSQEREAIKFVLPTDKTTDDAGNVLARLIRVRSDLLEEPKLASWIRQRNPKLVAMSWVGIVPYYTDVAVLDTLGLNDLHIAHLPKPSQRGVDTKMDPQYVMDREPDLIFVNVDKSFPQGKSTFEAAGGWKIGDRQLLELLMKSDRYELVEDAPINVSVFQRIKR
jgi:arabinofuranosyltransferase